MKEIYNKESYIEAVKFNGAFYILNYGKVVGECYSSFDKAVHSKIYKHYVDKYLNSESFKDFLDVLSDWN